MKLSRFLFIIFPLVVGCSTVGPGRVGVLWTTGSGTQPGLYGEGAYGVWPWNNMYVYDLRTMDRNEMLNVIASNGLQIDLDTSIRFHLEPKEVVALQEQTGPQYYSIVIEPVLRSEARRVLGQYTPEEIYSTKRNLIEREIFEGLQQKVAGRHIVVEAVLIRNVELPDAIREAIDKKLEAEQDVLRMGYVLDVSRSQAKQREIDAGGIADYNRKVASSLNPSILEFERIQELTELAKSPNSKTVVVGPEMNSRLLLSTATASAKK